MVALDRAAGANPALPIISNQVFIVTNTMFAGGAYGDGASNNTAAIQAAITYAGSHGGGTVKIPPVGTLTTYLCGPLTMASQINLQIDTNATLKMLPLTVFTNYPGQNQTYGNLIYAKSMNDLEISGKGTLDGNGADWWATSGTLFNNRPYMIFFNGSCTRVWIRDVTLQNPPKMHIVFKNSSNKDITITNITINTTDANAANTDGIDLVGKTGLVQNCTINTGDDNIAIGSSTASAIASDIVITNCTFGVGHGVSIGSNTAGGITNLLVTDCSFSNTDYGIRMKSNDATSGGSGQGGMAQDLFYTNNITMSNIVHGAIVIYSYYGDHGFYGTPVGVTPYIASTQQVDATSIPVWRNITINCVTATVANGGIAGIIWGRKEVPVTNAVLNRVKITAPAAFDVYNARAIRFVDSTISVPGSADTFDLYNAELTITNSVFVTNLVTLGGLATPLTNNPMAFFNATATIADTNMLGNGPITLGGSTLSFKQGSVNSSNTPITIVSASTLTLTSGTNALNGTLSGPGLLTLNLTNSNIMLALQGDAAGFTGGLAITNNGTLRFNQGTNTWGGANAAFDAGASGTINNRSTSDVAIYLGALSGGSGSKLRGSDQAGPGVDTYVIGGLNSNTTFAGTITNGTNVTTPHLVALTKIGSGTLTLTGTNSYGGSTTVSNGTLLVSNIAGSGTGTGAVTVVSSATLGGNGVIGGPVTVDGTLGPGNSVGTLTISNSLVVNSGAALQYALGTNGDLTAVSSDLTLGGTLNITDAGGFTNTTYRLFNYGGTLTYNGLAIGTTPSVNFTYTVSTNTAGQVNLVVDNLGTAPVASFAASPTNGVEPLGVTFTDTSTGSLPLSLSWDFGDSTVTNTAGAASFTHPYAAGTYSVTLTASNAYGTSTVVSNNLVSVITAWQAWQLQYFGCTTCPQADGQADPDGDGMSNTNEFLSGTSPTNSQSALRILSTVRQTTDVVITWATAGGTTNMVQASAGDTNVGYTNNFTDISGLIIILGSGDVTTNYVDVGGATGSPARYYRVRLVP